MDAALRINDDCRRGGARGRLLNLLRVELERLLPEDAAEILERRPGPVTIVACRLIHTSHLLPQGVFLRSFTDRDALIEAVLVSSCIPFYAAATPCCSLGGWPAVDGFFGVERSRFGCAATGASRDLAVSAFNYNPASVGRLVPTGFYDPDVGQNDLICPGIFQTPFLSTDAERLQVAICQPPAPDDVLLAVYAEGQRDADAWCAKELATV